MSHGQGGGAGAPNPPPHTAPAAAMLKRTKLRNYASHSHPSSISTQADASGYHVCVVT